MCDDFDFVDVGSLDESGKLEIEIGIDCDVVVDLGVLVMLIGWIICILLVGEEIGFFEDVGECYVVRV